VNAARELHISPTRRSALRRLYGMDEDDLVSLLAIVRHRCPICLKPFTPRRIPQIDHGHGGQQLVRGPLCARCNFDLLGCFGDDPDFYQRVVDYLRYPPATHLDGPARRAPGAPTTG